MNSSKPVGSESIRKKTSVVDDSLLLEDLAILRHSPSNLNDKHTEHKRSAQHNRKLKNQMAYYDSINHQKQDKLNFDQEDHYFSQIQQQHFKKDDYDERLKAHKRSKFRKNQNIEFQKLNVSEEVLKKYRELKMKQWEESGIVKPWILVRKLKKRNSLDPNFAYHKEDWIDQLQQQQNCQQQDLLYTVKSCQQKVVDKSIDSIQVQSTTRQRQNSLNKKMIQKINSVRRMSNYFKLAHKPIVHDQKETDIQNPKNFRRKSEEAISTSIFQIKNGHVLMEVQQHKQDRKKKKLEEEMRQQQQSMMNQSRPGSSKFKKRTSFILNAMHMGNKNIGQQQQQIENDGNLNVSRQKTIRKSQRSTMLLSAKTLEQQISSYRNSVQQQQTQQIPSSQQLDVDNSLIQEEQSAIIEEKDEKSQLFVKKFSSKEYHHGHLQDRKSSNKKERKINNLDQQNEKQQQQGAFVIQKGLGPNINRSSTKLLIENKDINLENNTARDRKYQKKLGISLMDFHKKNVKYQEQHTKNENKYTQHTYQTTLEIGENNNIINNNNNRHHLQSAQSDNNNNDSQLKQNLYTIVKNQKAKKFQNLVGSSQRNIKNNYFIGGSMNNNLHHKNSKSHVTLPHFNKDNNYNNHTHSTFRHQKGTHMKSSTSVLNDETHYGTYLSSKHALSTSYLREERKSSAGLQKRVLNSGSQNQSQQRIKTEGSYQKTTRREKKMSGNKMLLSTSKKQHQKSSQSQTSMNFYKENNGYSPLYKSKTPIKIKKFRNGKQQQQSTQELGQNNNNNVQEEYQIKRNYSAQRSGTESLIKI